MAGALYSLVSHTKSWKVAKFLRNYLHKSPILRTVAVNILLKNERSLVKARLAARSDHRSIIHFTVRKAASQFVSRVIAACARQNNIIPINLEAYTFNGTFPYVGYMNAEEFSKYSYIFRDRGFCYAPFTRVIWHIPNMNEFYKVVVLRDPRDLLTSDYYSAAFSHVVPGNPTFLDPFNKMREWAKSVTVDEFALGQKDSVLSEWHEYIRFVKQFSRVHVSKYEDVMLDFPRWLDQVLAFCELTIDGRLRDKLIADAAPPKKEDPYSKRRKALPGDYRNKLQPKTIDALNATFRDVLAQFGYT
jgi:hypothetical protein